ncbi:hypothetical protein [Asaia platycodi]|uniref:hypothetical protein n=1 Tax=Asaia platycodi TaxID=610243 RepID=UPI0011DD3598|nr:hypothetical protein [Asaia platycodi]
MTAPVPCRKPPFRKEQPAMSDPSLTSDTPMPEAGQKAMSSREVSNAAPEASETVESDVHQAG